MKRLIYQIPYISSISQPVEIPFARFLPLDEPGVIQKWLEKNAPRGSLVLDPLGASPTAVLEAAASGYRVLVACNNPVTAFELRMLASAPSKEEFTSAVGELAAQKKGEERLERSLSSLYLTRCATCGVEIPAEGFLWRRTEALPYARLYTCPHCGDTGEHTITDEDVQRLQLLTRGERLHRARALERVLGGELDDRDSVEAAVNTYPVRALYMLFVIMNKLEGMQLPTRRRALLEALVLTLLDAGNAIWAWPEERERPRQLSVPAQYLEKNLWLEIDHAIQTWCARREPLELTTWPDLPEGSGICLYPGRVRDLVSRGSALKIDHIVTVFPRPNQAFWSLCSLWASWLWGRQKAGRFSQVIERRRFDWHWHTTALHSALLPAASLAGDGISMYAQVPEPTPGLLSSVIQSAAISGFNLRGCAVKDLSKPIQVEWKTNQSGREYKPVNMQRTAREVIRDLLHEIGEPTEHIEIHTAAMCALAEENAFPPSIQQFTYEKAGEVQSVLNTLLADQDFLRRMNATAQDPESGLWWLAQPETGRPALADRVELELLSWLQTGNSLSLENIIERINQRFPGFLTPPDNLVMQCLDSYALLDSAGTKWSLKDSERLPSRQANVEEMTRLLDEIAAKLKARVEGTNPTVWYLENDLTAPAYRLLVLSNAVIEREVIANGIEGCRTIVIIPGSRAGLLKFKIDRDPYLKELVDKAYHFVKFRTLRSIAARSDLSREVWQVLIDSDPLSLEETTQLSMFR